MNQNFSLKLNWWALFIAWVISLVATLGSLFFSEVMNYPPCVLCWYQRICIYPLVLVLGMGLLFDDKSVFKFTLPQVFVGWGIALYHNLLYYKWIPENLAPCKRGISCTSIHLEWLGFITIPLLSFIAFTLLLIIFFIQFGRKNEPN